MSDPTRNPFAPDDPDRREIWDMLVDRDIGAFIACDWAMVADDFIAAEFFGVDAGRAGNPDAWALAFPTLEAYRAEWLRQAEEFARQDFAEDPKLAIFNATKLTEIEINGDRAVAHKKFDGTIARADGERDTLKWQTLYFCRRDDGRHRIVGFCGYLPYPMGAA